jgi:hypothetical protein
LKRGDEYEQLQSPQSMPPQPRKVSLSFEAGTAALEDPEAAR